MTHLDIVRDLTQAQTITIHIRSLDFTQPPAAEFEIEIEPEEAEEMATFNTSVSASSDDAAQYGSTVTLTDSTIGLYWSDYYHGFRFTNVTVPNSATITSAKLTVNVVNTSNDTPNCTLYGEDTDDAATFTTASNNISGRTKTTASVSWTASDIGVGVKDSPDIKTIIQEIVDRAGWTSGNDLNLILQGSTTSALAIHAYDGGLGSSYYPAITIEYTTSSSGANPKTARIRLTTKVGGTLTR